MLGFVSQAPPYELAAQAVRLGRVEEFRPVWSVMEINHAAEAEFQPWQSVAIAAGYLWPMSKGPKWIGGVGFWHS
jgi:hypothetical protein